MTDVKGHYVYAYLDPRKPGKYLYGEVVLNYEPFYIGMGKGLRLYGHMKQSERKNKGKNSYKNEHKIRIINKILIETNQLPIILKLCDNLTQQEAMDKEIYFIKAIGRHDLKTGPLTNKTDGGDGCRNQSPLSRLNFGNKMKEKYKIGEMVSWNKGKQGLLTEETRSAISRGLKSYYKNNKVWNEGVKGKQVAWNRGLNISDPSIKKYSESRKKNHNYKEYKVIRGGEVLIIKDLGRFCKDNDLNRRDLYAIITRGFRLATWKNKQGKIFEYRYDYYKDFKKCHEEAMV